MLSWFHHSYEYLPRSHPQAIQFKLLIGSMSAQLQERCLFFERTKIVEVLAKRLEAFQKGYRQNVAVIGNPLSGKTSLLRHFLKTLEGSDLLVFPFSCQESDSFELFSQRWMTELLLGYHRAFQMALPDHLGPMIQSIKGVIPRTLEKMKTVKRWMMKRRYDQAFQELIGLTGVLHEECGRKILVVLDDFDRLGELGLHDPFSDFGKEMMVQKDTMFLIASSRRNRTLSIVREKLSLLFGNFELIEVGSLDFDEVDGLMKVYLGESLFSQEEVRFLIRLTDGHIYYLDVLAHEMSRLRDERRDSGVGLSEVLAKELADPKGHLFQYFRGELYRMAHGKPWVHYADVLAAISVGHQKLTPVSRFLKQKGSDISKRLERLFASEFIQKHGSLLQVRDPLFRFWLAKVYYRERFLGRWGEGVAEAVFLDVLKALEESAFADKRELPNRIEELFLQFGNDVIQMNERNFKCPHFTEVYSRPNNGRVFPVFARNAHTRWLCQVLSDRVTEEDVHTFRKDLKKLRGSIHKRLIIGLKGIDLNAKLLAQEAKIQYLDLRHFNFLLDLYNKPKFVC